MTKGSRGPVGPGWRSPSMLERPVGSKRVEQQAPEHSHRPRITVRQLDRGVEGWCVELLVEGLPSADHARRAAELLCEYVGEPLPRTSVDAALQHLDYPGH